ncbi:hypothetical protein AVEN_267819-1 [Araneus ventricosus]|uniref:Uncharacterized protein n=1 Tax=Araneus ventricosus TaxID=182803 RepID=A0A4Y2D4L9_ARAVE|nr:hypothetical protein AVEN_267819-1 [Araneus ventricosus]
MKSKQGNKTHWTELLPTLHQHPLSARFPTPGHTQHGRPWTIPVKNCHRTIYMKIGLGNSASSTTTPLHSRYIERVVNVAIRRFLEGSPISEMIGSHPAEQSLGGMNNIPSTTQRTA